MADCSTRVIWRDRHGEGVCTLAQVFADNDADLAPGERQLIRDAVVAGDRHFGGRSTTWSVEAAR